MTNQDENIVGRAQRLAQAEKSAWSEIYEAARNDLNFLSDEQGAQWNERDYKARVESGRPALTIDQLSKFTHQVVNDIKQNTPTIKIIPHSGGADIETADVIAGLIKDIEYNSGADEAYDTAATFAVKSSIGYIRIDHDYADDGFEQELQIKRAINPQAVYLDHRSIEIDGSDALHGFVFENIKVSEFRKKYPEKDPCSFWEIEQKEDVTEESEITIAEFFEVVDEKRRIGLTEEGETENYEEGKQYVSERETSERIVKRYMLSGNDVLDETTFPGIYIPIIPVYGEESWENGKRKLFSLIRKAKDAQRMYNFWKSVETEILMNQPRAPIMAAEGQVEEYRDEWLSPDKSAVLRYRNVDVDGKPAPPPQRLMPPQTPVGIVNASRMAVDDIKATMGMFDASIGQRSNETSGIAIAQRKAEGDIATYHYGDNLVKSITHVGRILVSAIPVVYDTARIIRIVGEEDEVKSVGINGEKMEDQERSFDLRKGRYSVRVITGAPFTTQRQEGAQFMADIIMRQPQMSQVFGDLLFKNMDFPGAQAIAERVKKTIPPQLLDENEGEIAPDPEKQQMQAIIEQGQQLIMQMQQQMSDLEKRLNDKTAELQIKARSEAEKAQNERFKIETEATLRAKEIENESRELDLKEIELAQRSRELTARAAQPQDTAQAV